MIPEQELNAFIDGELDAAATERIGAIVDASPDLAGRVARLKEDKARIARVYGPLIDRKLPEALLRSIEAATAPPPSRLAWRIGAGLAAAAAVLVAWFAYPLLVAPSADDVVAEALAARGGKIAFDRQIDAPAALPHGEGDTLLHQTIGAGIQVPDLSKAGFQLASMTAYPMPGGRHAVQLGYRDRTGRLFTVFLHDAVKGDAFEVRERGPMRICIWRTEDLSAVMLAQRPTTEMLRVASLAYADLNF
jgi:anti-sigma factor RsiW